MIANPSDAFVRCGRSLRSRRAAAIVAPAVPRCACTRRPGRVRSAPVGVGGARGQDEGGRVVRRGGRAACTRGDRALPMPRSLERAARALDRGAGTVWAGDAREGFNGGGALRPMGARRRRIATRRVAQFLPHVRPRARRRTFVDGVPCSIHGFVVDDGVAVLRPVEFVTLRAPTAPRLRYCGCATFFDPPADVVAAMRAAARRGGRVPPGDGRVSRRVHRRRHRGPGRLGRDRVQSTLRRRARLRRRHVARARPRAAPWYAVVEGVADVATAELGAVRGRGRSRDPVRWGVDRCGAPDRGDVVVGARR